MNAATTPALTTNEPRLTSLSHGGGCGCKIAPGVLSEILKGTAAMPLPKELLVGIETADDAALAALMRRFAAEPHFAAKLREHVLGLEPRFAPDAERAAVRALLADLVGAGAEGG